MSANDTLIASFMTAKCFHSKAIVVCDPGSVTPYDGFFKPLLQDASPMSCLVIQLSNAFLWLHLGQPRGITPKDRHESSLEFPFDLLAHMTDDVISYCSLQQYFQTDHTGKTHDRHCQDNDRERETLVINL